VGLGAYGSVGKRHQIYWPLRISLTNWLI